jgi:putative copper resistance protein D
MTSSRRALVAAWCAAVIVAGVAMVALALVLGRGAPPPAPPGLADTARVPAWMGAITSFLVVLVGVATVGFGLLASGLLDRPRPAMRAVAAGAAGWWAALTIFQFGLLSSELRGSVDVLDTARARALLLQLVLALVAALGWWLGRRRSVALLALTCSLAALLPNVIAGHPRASDHPAVAALSVSAHVVGAALWVGGLAAIAWLAAIGDGRWGDALPRYSRLALACVVALTLAGVLTSTLRLNSITELWSSRYGAIVTFKVVLLAGLAGAGWLQRRYVFVGTPMLRRHFLIVAALELTTMTMALALAAALERTPPPV